MLEDTYICVILLLTINCKSLRKELKFKREFTHLIFRIVMVKCDCSFSSIWSSSCSCDKVKKIFLAFHLLTLYTFSCICIYICRYHPTANHHQQSNKFELCLLRAPRLCLCVFLLFSM